MTGELVRCQIRERLSDGRLPRDYTIELWRMQGSGETCDACGDPIAATDLMCLLCSVDWRAIRVHECCLELWDDERRVKRTDGTR